MHLFQRINGSLLPTLGALALTLTLVAPLAARADDEIGGASVARISTLSGSVAVQRGDSNSSIDAAVNAPILGADYITTGPGSRAEIQFDGSSMVRLGENVQMRFTNIDPANRELQLAEGTIDVRLLHGVDGSTTVDTPSVSVHPQEGGSYRITVLADGDTRVTVRSGRANIITPQGTQSVAPGSTLVASGSAANPQITSIDPIALDQFDHFNSDRDQLYTAAVANAPYVNQNIQGVGDLTEYGRWVPDPQYGRVWAPYNVAADWAPYRDGRWAWEDGYGWTWVSAEPWGWAPYHYGSWYHSPTYGWAWYPPRPAIYAPVWRPALVAFIGFGGGGGVSIGFGNSIGWVPLAPGEIYHPWYGNGYYGGGSRTIINNTNVTNVTNVTNITNIYRNSRFSGVTSVSQQDFQNGSFRRPLAVSATSLRSVRVANGAIPVVPTQANLRYTEHVTQVANRPIDVPERGFAGHAVSVTRVPFEEQRTTLATVAHLPQPIREPQRQMVTAPNPTIVQPNRFAPQNRTLALPQARTAPVTQPGTAAAPQAGYVRPTGNPSWERFNNARTPAVNAHLDPRVSAPAAQRAHTYPTATTPQPAAQTNARTDAWSRFNTTHGSVVNGSAATTPTRANGAPVGRPNPQRYSQPVGRAQTQPQAPVARQRTYPQSNNPYSQQPHQAPQARQPQQPGESIPRAQTQAPTRQQRSTTAPRSTAQPEERRHTQ